MSRVADRNRVIPAGTMWPYENILAFADSMIHDPDEKGVREMQAHVLGVSGRSVHRWIAAGGLSDVAADQVACRNAVHPSWVWPDWFTIVDLTVEIQEQKRSRRYAA